jgi:hypothetical protein
MSEIKDIIRQFNIDGTFISAEPYGGGHINETRLVALRAGDEKRLYILQRINHSVFKNVPALMENIYGVTEYIRRAAEKEGGEPSQCLCLVQTRDNANFLFFEDEYYRCYTFIEGAESIEVANSPEQLYIAGRGFGQFQRRLNGYPAGTLHESIPDFHNTEKRFEAFTDAVQANPKGRRGGVKAEIEFYTARKEYCRRIRRQIESGQIPLRVTHNDTKLNNILIDTAGKKAVAVIDLDTVMPGAMAYDFGDCVRSGTNTGAEDDVDLDNVTFSLSYFEAFAKGFLREVKGIATQGELESMATGAILMTYECGMRFLTDYLNGDVYFRIRREQQNLDRARTQMKMLQEMESALPFMNETVEKYGKRNASANKEDIWKNSH